MSTTPWVQDSPTSYSQTVSYQPGTPGARLFQLFLEVISGPVFNWKLTVSEHNGVLFTREFLLSGVSNTPAIAQQEADLILTKYLQGHLSP